MILGERQDKSVLPELRELIFSGPSQETALAALWAHYVTDGFDEALAIGCSITRPNMSALDDLDSWATT